MTSFGACNSRYKSLPQWDLDKVSEAIVDAVREGVATCEGKTVAWIFFRRRCRSCSGGNAQRFWGSLTNGWMLLHYLITCLGHFEVRTYAEVAGSDPFQVIEVKSAYCQWYVIYACGRDEPHCKFYRDGICSIVAKLVHLAVGYMAG